MVPDCTLVQTARGPTPLNHPAIPSVLYIIFRPVMTEDVSRVAAPWALRVVEGEDVEIGLLCVDFVFVVCEGVECFEVAAGESGALGAGGEAGDGPLCWVWMRVLTTSRGVVMTPAMPPAVAAVAISSGSPMLFEPMYFLAQSRSSS